MIDDNEDYAADIVAGCKRTLGKADYEKLPDLPGGLHPGARE